MVALKSMVEEIRLKILGMEEGRLSQNELLGRKVQLSRKDFVRAEVMGILI